MSINEPLALIRRHQFDEALPLLASEVRAHPDDPYAAYYLAYAFLGAQDPQPALTLLTNLLQHHPGFLDARNLFGLASIRTSNFSAATREYQEVLNRDPQNAAALLGLGMIHYWKREMALAEEYLSRALRRDPRARDALVFKADVRFAEGNVTAAVSLILEARRCPTPSLPEVSDIEISDRLARYEAALTRRRRPGLPVMPAWVQGTVAATLLLVLVALAGLPGAWNGMAHYQDGKHRLAVSDYRGCAGEMSEAIAAVPNSSKAWAYAAYCNLLDGDASAGLSAWYTARSFEAKITLDTPEDQRALLAKVTQATRPRNEQR